MQPATRCDRMPAMRLFWLPITLACAGALASLAIADDAFA